MGGLIDIVGHFGTTFSYATVGSRVARALMAEDMLGRVTNLDPTWHDSHVGLKDRPNKQGSHVVLFTPPHHYIDVFAGTYGRENAAIFMSPNTDELHIEHSTTCSKFGLAIAPSDWCARTVRKHSPDVDVVILPLGVGEVCAEDRESMIDMRFRKITSPIPARAVHFSTDQSWPGRKGTEELIEAWALADISPSDGGLMLHVPPAISRDVMHAVRDAGIHKTVEVATADAKGTDQIEWAVNQADLIIAPSRCEGFGMMFLSALVSGVPLLCTYNTGQVDFLKHSPAWLGVPSGELQPMSMEVGLAPTVDVRALANAIGVAVTENAREQMLDKSASFFNTDPEWGLWRLALPEWTEQLKKWTEK